MLPDLAVSCQNGLAAEFCNLPGLNVINSILVCNIMLREVAGKKWA